MIFTWFGPYDCNTLRPREMFVLICVLLFKAKLNLFWFWRLLGLFIFKTRQLH
jgi:hypothetical protein